MKQLLIMLILCFFCFAGKAQNLSESGNPHENTESSLKKYDKETLCFGGLSYINTVTYSGMIFNKIVAMTGDGEIVVLKEFNCYMNGNTESLVSISECFDIPRNTKSIGLTCTFIDSYGVEGFLEFESCGQTPVKIEGGTQTFWKELQPGDGEYEIYMYLHFYGE